MKNYLGYLESLYNHETSQRKIDYIRYNFSPYLKKLNKNSRILEIGPGFGEFINILNAKGITNIDILDNSKEVLEYNKSHYKLDQVFLTPNISSADKKIGQYDLIFLLQVLEHIPPEKYKDVIQILYKHLKSTGYIIITVPNAGNLLGLSERYNDLQHQASFTEISLRELPAFCEIENYQVEIKGYRIPPYNLINILRIIAQRFFHFFLSILYLINGGVYLKIYHPNISLIIKKNKSCLH
ncbi:hypothetical protein COT44_02510 [Candidatus Shapirobacteria bacterium CG08_land_8_20_14_0_20_39_18]|uniref:Class I SAM-dependent methyltransferase n=1 Tax=Candidatus Shapirobacteria bacterium CG08_land_8_20_14_0_20_39_18 TaxID=1974883 RepID=A0A2M6XD42_9BACT|nr:MAG: hypothetical protein COT44_02510 [Candidatus Shapirobacteria bacterium CG08_land_8_20_14_0_20_39_18]PIY65270.1 MAG: hypothetical protein COY91_02530 [Candidatus Shapirobacteria bacterium CG_4_10_14_0_8_um_filter_39_15]